MNEKVYDEKAERLFLTPYPPPTVLCPQRWPGCNFESSTAVRHAFIDNRTRYYIFRNYIKFHNHVTHRALAIYALGGSGPVIEAFYKRDIKIQKDAFVSPHPITAQNFVDHLGLSMAAMHEVRYPDFLPPSVFVARPSDDIGAMMNNFASLVLDDQSFAMPLKAPRPSLASKGPRHYTGQYPDTLVAHGCRIRDHVQKWTVDLSRPGEIERKMEGCIWVSSVMYPLGGWCNGFTADFFLIVLPSLIAHLSPRAQALLLRAYLSRVVACEHHPKIQRAFPHFSTIYGIRPKGYFAETELDGAEELDGSLFVRAAVLTADYMGWAREGEEAGNWSYEGFYV
ncbi:hypothetical protein EV424DRAFT_1542900 [Suillus variegatus]|nr:hypothetical protein EV424DRAFT_1542900 [Suillus variegatus]